MLTKDVSQALYVIHQPLQPPQPLCMQLQPHAQVDNYPSIESDLSALGYEGVYAQRTGGRQDGCATFWCVVNDQIPFILIC